MEAKLKLKAGIICAILIAIIGVAIYSYKQYELRKERGNPIEWHDPEVERQIKQQLGKTGDIWTGEVKEYPTHILLEGENIHDLEDLCNFPNLNVLVLHGIGEIDFTPLKDAKNLVTLSIDGGKLTSLDSLGHLDFLEYLDISNVPVASVQGLDSLGDLQSLCLRNLDIQNISALNVASLVFLKLDDLPIKDISVLENAHRLENFYMESTQVGDVSPLSDLECLETISILNSPIKKGDFSNSQLRSLEIRNTKISKIPKLPETLQTLQLDNNMVHDFREIRFLPNLDELEISNIPAESLMPDLNTIGEGSKLQYLTLTGDHLNNLGGIEKLRTLQTLDVSNNQLTETSQLENLDSLYFLDISYNPVLDLSGIEKMKSLSGLSLSGVNLQNENMQKEVSGMDVRNLCISGCNLDNIHFISALINIEILDISRNNIGQLDGIEGLEHITSLNLSENPLVDLSPLQNLTALSKLNISDIDMAAVGAEKGTNILSKLRLQVLKAKRCNLDNINFFTTNMPDIDVSDNHIQTLPNLDWRWISAKIDLSGNLITDDYMKKIGAFRVFPGLYRMPNGKEAQIKIDKNVEFLYDYAWQ